ncbi:DUF1573 domain-containing protein [Planctomycetota bacterium]
MIILSASLWKLVKVVGIVVIAAILIVTVVLLPKSTFSTQDAITASIVSGLVCDKNSHNLGSMTLAQADQREHTFVLTNTSKHPIKLLKQSSTCGCTVAELNEGTIVPPSGAVKVPVKANWAGRAGPQSAVVTIITDDSKTPTISLRVSGFVKVPVIVTPAVVNFGLLKPGQQATRVVELHPGTDPRPFRLTAIEIPSANISLSRLPEKVGEEPKLLLEGNTGKFTVKITAPRISGREETRVVFRTDLDNRSEVWLDVKAKFENVFVSTPKSILFSDSDDADVTLREVKIRCTDKKVNSDPEVQLIWEDNEMNPFFVEKIVTLDKKNDSTLIVAVGFNRNKVKQVFNRAVLRINGEVDHLDIPILAMGRLKK